MPLDLKKYRDPELCERLAGKLSSMAKNIKGGLCFMEVCGTHTHSFLGNGLDSLLPKKITLLSGPGCPVCVTPVLYIDKAVFYSRKGCIITTFGDLFRVPGSETSLEKEKAAGADIRIVYSPVESLSIAEENPDKKVIFLGVGFETTIPTTAVTLLEARKKKLNNWFLLSGHKLIPPAMQALLNSRELRIDGFMCPGHVSAVIGAKPYGFIPREYGIPCVITGFEPVDMLQGIYLLADQCIKKKPGVLIQYSRAVKEEGNPKAVELMREVFSPADSDWRGIGTLPGSGLVIRKKYGGFDIEKNTRALVPARGKEPKGCICGEILCGVKKPVDCRLFGKACTPENPVGACMVSSEGTCSAYFKYQKGNFRFQI